jgi:hypothetical protein
MHLGWPYNLTMSISKAVRKRPTETRDPRTKHAHIFQFGQTGGILRESTSRHKDGGSIFSAYPNDYSKKKKIGRHGTTSTKVQNQAIFLVKRKPSNFVENSNYKSI